MNLKSKIRPTKADLLHFVRNEPRAILWDVIGSFFYGLGISFFALNADFAPGGITGVAMILNYLFKQPIGLLSIFINIPIIIVSLRYLGTMYLVRTFQTLILNAVFIDYVFPLLPSYQDLSPASAPLLAAIFAGAFSGLGLAMIYNAGTCTGGSDLVIMSVKKVKPHLSIGQITMFTDGAIIIAGAFVYKNIDAILYGIIYTLVSTIVIDKYMNGVIAGKMTFIISDKSQEIYQAISGKIGRGATFLKGEGAYSGAEKKILLVASNNKQLPDIRGIVRETDAKALMIVSDYNEVRGEGFIPMQHDN